MFRRRIRMTPMTKYRFLISMLFLVNLASLNQGNADGVLKNVDISRGIDQNRRNTPFQPMYHWEFENQTYTIKIEIDAKSYNKLRHHKKGRHRKHTKNLVSIVQDGAKTLGPLVDEFRRVMPFTWSQERQVNFVLGFVQCLPYVKDKVSTGLKEYYRYPIETLVDAAVDGNGVDCEDTSLLFASILEPLDFKVALILVPRHVAVGVKGPLTAARFWNNQYSQSDYLYCETTVQGWRLAQVPIEYQGIQWTVMPITLQPSSPKKVLPDGNLPKPKPPPPLSSQEKLQEGIKLYEEGRFNEAIKFLRSALNGLSKWEHQAKAHLYLGCSKWGFGEARESTISEFQKALRHNPNLRLPTRIGKEHPVFKPMLEKARKESTGTLTITASLPQTKIWIGGGLIKRKMLGTGTASTRLIEGNYTVEGVFERATFGRAYKKETVRIKPSYHTKLKLSMPTVVKHDVLAKALPGQTLPLTLHVVSAEKPKQVEVYYVKYDLHGNKLEQSSKGMLLRTEHPKSSTWVYHVNLPSPAQAGKIMYFIKIDKTRIPETQYHQISIAQSKPPEIAILKPPDGASFNAGQPITIKAQVKSSVPVDDVRIYYDFAETQLSETSPSRLLKEKPFSNTYVGEIPTGQNQNGGYIWYFVTASNVDGRETKSEVGFVRIRALKDMTLKIVPPLEITILEPRDDASFNLGQAITINANVKSSVPVDKVRVYYNFAETQLSETSPSRLLKKKPSSDTYVGEIPTRHNQNEGYIWYFVTATNVQGKKAKSDVRSVRARRGSPRPAGEKEVIEPTPPPQEPSPRSPLHEGVWASHSWSNVARNGHFNSDWERGNVASIAYLREGKGFQTLGAQLDFSYDNPVNTSGIVQWGPSLGESPVAFAFLAGAAGYRSSDASFSRTRQSTQITPILGGSVKFYPLDRVAVDVTGSIKLRSENSAADRESSFTKEYLHHYEMGIRLYISPTLNLRAGYGRWRLGDYDNTSVQIGLGATF